MLRIRGNKFKHLAGLSYAGLAGSSAAFLLILAAMLFAPAASQPEASATDDNSGISTYAATPTVGISLPTSINFADVLPTPSGATTTATADLTITTTDSAGYSLYLYSSDGDNSLKPKISSLANISTINATAGDVGLTLSSLEPNTWGYYLGTSEATDSTTYAAVPTDSTTPVQTKDTSDTNAANDTYTLSLGAKVDSAMPSGTYSSELTFAIVAEPGGIVITYDANGGHFGNDSSKTTELISYQITGNTETKIAKTSNIADDGTNTGGGYGDNVSDTQTVTIPGAQSLKVTVTCSTESAYFDLLTICDGSSKTIASLGGTANAGQQTFTISGDTVKFHFTSNDSYSDYYGYYAVVQDASTVIAPSAELSTPTRSGYDFLGWYKDATNTDSIDFTVNASVEAGTVYAKWGLNSLSSVTYMQDLTATQCSDSYDGAAATLLDRRDNNSYTIAKINNNCWMTQNLRIAGGTTLTNSTSNVASNYYLPNNDLTAGDSYTEARLHNSGDTTKGYWYNFCAASAGTKCTNSDTTDTVYDICPKGWRLPSRTEANAISDYSDSLYTVTFSPSSLGWYSKGSLDYGSMPAALWWTSTATSYGYGQYQITYGDRGDGFGYDYLGTGYIGGGSRTYGAYVRCIKSD